MGIVCTKPFLTLSEQVALLQNRGLLVCDETYAEVVLAQLNYYRFSAYSLTLRKNDRFLNGVTFEQIKRIYDMDAELRQLILRFASIVEVSLRSHEAYIHAKNHGPLGYRDTGNFVNPEYHRIFIRRLEQLLNDSKEPFVLHHRNDLGGHYPFWVAVEVMTFDVASKALHNMLPEDRTEISQYYNIRRRFLENWMHCAVIARNIAAHGGRFYNRPLSTKLLIPHAVKGSFSPDCAFAYLYGLYHLLENTEDKEKLIEEFEELLKNHRDVDTSHLGVPKEWRQILEQPL